MQLAVYVYGNSQLYSQYFNAIATTVGATGFATAVRLAILLGGATALFNMITKRDIMELVRWLAVFYVAMYIALAPKVTVAIEDRTIDHPAGTVDHVPLGVAALAHFTSAIGAGMTELVESIFHPTTSETAFSYHKTGLVMASKMVATASQFQIKNAEFSHNMQEFVNQCVFYDLLLGKYSFEQLLNTDDIWGLLTQAASPARAFSYNNNIIICKEGIKLFTEAWKTEIADATLRYGYHFFPNQTDVNTQFASYLKASYGFLLNASKDASQILQQNMLANALQQGVSHFAATTNSSAAIQSYIESKSQLQQRLTYQSIGEQAAYWLQLLKNTLEMVMYGAFILVILLAFMPSGMGILKNYALGLLWLQSWAPLYAIINFAVSYYAQAKSQALGTEITLHNLDGLATVNLDMAALAGYLTLSVPFFAAGLTKGMVSTLGQMAQYAGGMVQTVSSGVASEAVAGNLSMGNTSVDTHSAFTLNANHMDTMGRYAFGGMSAAMSGGGNLTMTTDGTSILNTQGGISQLSTQVRVAESLRSMSSQQAEASFSAGLNQSHAYGESLTSSLRDLNDLASTAGKTESAGHSASVSQNDSLNHSLSEMHRLTEQFRKEHGLTYQFASDVLTTSYANANAAGNIKGGIGPVGLSGGVDTGIKHDSSDRKGSTANNIYSAAQDFVNESGYSKNVSSALSAIHDKHYHFNTEEGQRLSNSVSASLDKAYHARDEANSHFQDAESYRKMASLSQENAVNIDSDARQAFYEWWRQQPSTDRKSHLSNNDIAAIEAHDPELARLYAKQFSDQYAQKLSHHWQGNLPSSASDLKQSYQKYSASVGNQDAVASHQASFQQHIEQQATQKGVHAHGMVDRSIQQAADEKSQTYQQDIANNRQDVDKKGGYLKDENKQKLAHQETYHIWNKASKDNQ